MSKEDVTKLPKWAQRRIEVLERDIESLRTQRQNNWAGDGDTDVFISNYVDGNIPLPKNSRIVFEMGEEPFDLTIEVQKTQVGKREVVEVYASGRHSNRLAIEPQSSNVVHARNQERWGP